MARYGGDVANPRFSAAMHHAYQKGPSDKLIYDRIHKDREACNNMIKLTYYICNKQVQNSGLKFSKFWVYRPSPPPPQTKTIPPFFPFFVNLANFV